MKAINWQLLIGAVVGAGWYSWQTDWWSGRGWLSMGFFIAGWIVLDLAYARWKIVRRNDATE